MAGGHPLPLSFGVVHRLLYGVRVVERNQGQAGSVCPHGEGIGAIQERALFPVIAQLTEVRAVLGPRSSSPGASGVSPTGFPIQRFSEVVNDHAPGIHQRASFNHG